MSLLFKNVISRVAAPVIRRNIFTTGAKRSSDPVIGHIEQEAVPGANLPFSISNRYKLALLFVVYFGSGFSVPFIVVRSQLTRKSA